jgi:hypothetical protein
MTAIRIPIKEETGGHLEVDVEEGYVCLSLHLDGERKVTVLDVDEARALAAMLDHQASELDR